MTDARPHHRLVTALVVAASLLAFLAVFAVWANRQALETDTWTETSTELLEDEDIRTAVAGFLVDELYANVDVEAELRERLPPEAAALAGPAAGGLRELANRVAVEALARPRVQELWEEANRRAHERLLAVIEGESEVLQVEGDTATLDLGALLENLSARTGVGGKIVSKLPEDAGEIKVLESDQIGLGQDLVRILRGLAIVLTAVALGLYALAVYLARGWRRKALRSVGVGFVLVGLAVLLARGLAGNAVVDALATTASVEPAIESTWEIGTSLLRATGVAMIGYGLLFLLAAWLAGPSGAATRLREALAPYLQRRLVAYSGVVVIVLLVLWWNPTPGTSRLAPTLILIGLLVAGVEALRRMTLVEFPDAEPGGLWDSMREAIPSRRREYAAAPAEDERLKNLERLNELHKAGILGDEELAREKQRILGQG
jgi:hypothetical protein